MNILITGVTSGIGLALAKEFSENSHNIIGCGTNQTKLNNLKLAHPQNHFLTKVDVGDDEMVKLWAKNVYMKYDKIDMIINNAGTKSQLLPTWEVSAKDYEQTIRINVLGIINVIRHFVPKMIQKNQGVVLNMTSEWGKYGDAYVSSYCASKFAVEGLTQSLAKEIPENMVAVALNPYFVRTDLLESCKSLFLPGEYELSIDPNEWAKFVVPKILKIDRSSNGKSIVLHPSLSVSHGV